MKVLFLAASKMAAALSRQLSDKLDIKVWNRKKRKYHSEFSVKVEYADKAALIEWADLIIFSSSDNAASSLIKECQFSEDKFYAHLSGSLGFSIFPEIFQPQCLVLHPPISISSYQPKAIDWCFLASMGCSSQKMLLESFFNALPGKVFLKEQVNFQDYHLGLCQMSAGFVASFEMALDKMKSSGLDEESSAYIAKKLAQSILKNLNRNSFPENLSGPIRRGDGKTLARHLFTLKGDELDLYLSTYSFLKGKLEDQES